MNNISVVTAKVLVMGNMSYTEAAIKTGVHRTSLTNYLNQTSNGNDSNLKIIDQVVFAYKIEYLKEYLTEDGLFLSRIFWANKYEKKDLTEEVFPACKRFKELNQGINELAVADADFYTGFAFFDIFDFENSVKYLKKAEVIYKREGKGLPENCAKSNRLLAEFQLIDKNRLTRETINHYLNELIQTDGVLGTTLSAMNLAEMSAYGNLISNSREYDMKIQNYLNSALERCNKAPVKALIVLIESDLESPLLEQKSYQFWKDRFTHS